MSFLSKLKPSRSKDELRYCSVYINTTGLSIAVTSNRFNTDALPIEYVNYIPFEETPSSELINYLLDKCVEENDLKGIPTNCILSRELYRLILVDIPENIPQSELREASKWMVKDLIDFPTENLASDVFLLPKFNQNENHAYVCVAKKHMLKVRQQQIITSELYLQNMDIIDLALTALTSPFAQNQAHVIVSLSGSYSTLLMIMNGCLCLKHDIDFKVDLSSESNQIADISSLPQKVENFISYFLAQLTQNYSVNIFVQPVGKYTDLIIDSIHSNLPYPVAILTPSTLFTFPENTEPSTINDSIVALGGLLNKE